VIAVSVGRRLPVTEHTSRPWRIHELTPDFRVLDVWAIRAPGSEPDDFPVMLAAIQAAGEREPLLVRFLFAVRWKLGALLGWDDPQEGLAEGGRVTALCERLPDDLRQPISGTPVPGLPFTQLYDLPDERAMEVANKTVHGVAHHGWVATENGDYELRMAVLVKANGTLGRAYMAAIAPFRHLIVYPALTQQWERAWRDRHELLGDPLPRPSDAPGP
jgi:hypothetical protein